MSRATATGSDIPVAVDIPGFVSRQADWGDLIVALEHIAPADFTEMFSKLPGGHCSCPHWGYVVSGRLRIKYGDDHPGGDEIAEAGDAYYMAPGHVPVIEEDTVLVEFSPGEEYRKTMAALED